MAFISILLINIVLTLFLLLLFVGIISIIISIVFGILYRKDKSKKWKKILSVVSGIVGLSIAGLFLIVIIASLNGSKEEIHLDNGTVAETSRSILNRFYNDIENGTISNITDDLESNPELMKSFSIEGHSPLAYAIKGKKLENVKFIVEKDVDVNCIDRENKYGTIEYILKQDYSFDESKYVYPYYDEQIMEYLLDLDDIDINKHDSLLPNIQAYIELVLNDNDVTETEKEILVKLLNKGANIHEVNGKSENTLQLLERLGDSKSVLEIKSIILNY